MTREEIIALAKQHGASAYTNRHYQDETYMTFSPEKLEAFFYAAQRLALEDVGILATVGATYPELMDYVQSELEAIRNRGTK